MRIGLITAAFLAGLFLFTPITPLFYADAQVLTMAELEELAKALRDKEAVLAAWEQELQARQDKLDALEKDLILREENLSAIRVEITQKLEQLDTQTNEELDRLAKLFSSTKPKQAASVIIMMDLDKSAALMSRISAMTAGKIMAEIAKQNPGYASKLTSKMAGDSEVKSFTSDNKTN